MIFLSHTLCGLCAWISVFLLTVRVGRSRMATSLDQLLKKLMMDNGVPVGPPTIRVLLVEDSITDKSIFELALRKPVQRFGQTVHFAVQWVDSI